MRKLKASATIELAYIMPVIFLAIWTAIYLGFYFHDKSILQGLVYEGLVIGSRSYRMEGEVEEEVIETFVMEMADEKLLIFSLEEIEIEETEGLLSIDSVAMKNGLSIEVEKSMVLTDPESAIRQSIIL